MEQRKTARIKETHIPKRATPQQEGLHLNEERTAEKVVAQAQRNVEYEATQLAKASQAAQMVCVRVARAAGRSGHRVGHTTKAMDSKEGHQVGACGACTQGLASSSQ